MRNFIITLLKFALSLFFIFTYVKIFSEAGPLITVDYDVREIIFIFIAMMLGIISAEMLITVFRFE
ncbi:hypothetical protein JFL43_20965 [Viridibacillus sp. YIM B01967]|uniref:Uncharacterized protein n=1 Tax=Viridibacillus soli TaxID=2798301 RepID=A0ABS1HCX2_9BACL|nr:hypothetical protein [Viridibacillus soli]MBK3497252.1 hypothetical protein [Viridibacillus soli]